VDSNFAIMIKDQNRHLVEREYIHVTADYY